MCFTLNPMCPPEAPLPKSSQVTEWTRVFRDFCPHVAGARTLGWDSRCCLASRAALGTPVLLAHVGVSLGFCAALFVGSPVASAGPGRKLDQERKWLGPRGIPEAFGLRDVLQSRARPDTPSWCTPNKNVECGFFPLSSGVSRRFCTLPCLSVN